MSDFTTTSVNSRVITAFFDTREAAQSASDGLVAIGVQQHQIKITEGGSNEVDGGATPHAEMGFWEQLKSMFLPQEDHHSYAEGLSRGGFLLSAQVDDALYDQALEVTDADGAVNMDEREATWRSSGWKGYRPEAETPRTSSGTAIGAAAGMAAEPALATPITAGPDDGGIAGYDASRLGVRDISHGRDRLRSYTLNPLADQAPLYREDPAKGVFGISERFSPATDAGAIAEHMDVIASDGVKIGTVDHLDGGRIKLTKSASPDGQHHFITLASVDHVDAHVHLKTSSAEAKASW